jgi:hypothetical protein
MGLKKRSSQNNDAVRFALAAQGKMKAVGLSVAGSDAK